MPLIINSFLITIRYIVSVGKIFRYKNLLDSIFGIREFKFKMTVHPRND